MKQTLNKWGLEWNQLKPTFRHLIFEDCKPCIFQTRKEAREYADQKYGYIKTRKDLRGYPHFWRMPKPVRIMGIEYERY